MAINPRQELLRSLATQIAAHDWAGCSRLYFQATFGLPARLQIDLAHSAVNGYLPIFQKKRPTVTWPGRLLENVEQCVSQFGRDIPEPGELDPADAAFVSSLDGLLLASLHMTDLLTVTSSCAAAIGWAINARASNVWIADDPEAVEMWRTQQYLVGRSMNENAAALCVAEREWSQVAAWLEERQIWINPEHIDEAVIAEALSRWEEHEMLVIVPRD
jgi:hypothetical protein